MDINLLKGKPNLFLSKLKEHTSTKKEVIKNIDFHYVLTLAYSFMVEKKLLLEDRIIYFWICYEVYSYLKPDFEDKDDLNFLNFLKYGILSLGIQSNELDTEIHVVLKKNINGKVDLINRMLKSDNLIRDFDLSDIKSVKYLILKHEVLISCTNIKFDFDYVLNKINQKFSNFPFGDKGVPPQKPSN